MKNKNVFIVVKDKVIDIKEGNKYENKDFCVISNQEIYDLNYNKISLKEVIKLYKDKVELANFISNTFSIIIIDKNKNKLSCFQDLNGDTIPIYYYKNENEIVFSNEIINIIKYSSKSFNMNEQAISYFIKKGYIPNKETLIKNISKLIPNYNLEIELESKKEKSVKKKIKFEKIKKYNVDLYIEEFKKILQINEKNKKVFITLSNGYDSNFIFRFLNKNKAIEAFSIGGVTGRDETQQVSDNIKDYTNTHLNVAYVSEKTLDNYPDLVYHLEGAMYEKGIFLQYELLNLIKEKEIKNTVMFCGEGSDQVFSYEYYNRKFYLLKSVKYILAMIKRPEEFKNIHIKGGFLYRNMKYNALAYIISKKNGILMNDININYIYPYLFRNIINMAYINRYVNFKDKKSHIEACNKEIDSKILKSMANVGGTTEHIALFKNCSYFEKIEKFVSKSKYNILKINNKSFSTNYLDYLLKVLYLEIFEYLFIKNVLNINDKKNIKLYQIIEEKNFDANEKNKDKKIAV